MQKLTFDSVIRYSRHYSSIHVLVDLGLQPRSTNIIIAQIKTVVINFLNIRTLLPLCSILKPVIITNHILLIENYIFILKKFFVQIVNELTTGNGNERIEG